MQWDKLTGDLIQPKKRYIAQLFKHWQFYGHTNYTGNMTPQDYNLLY